MSDDAPVEAVVLVGGKGSRLQQVLRDRPKPMALVNGRPFLSWILLGLHARGVRRVILAMGHKGEQIQAGMVVTELPGLDVVFSHETRPLGTGGAVRNALPLLSGRRVLVANGDSICPFEIERLVGLHEENNASATLWLLPHEDRWGYGSVDINNRGLVVSFREKPPGRAAGFISAGVYLIECHVLEAIPSGEQVSLENEVFPSLVGKLFGVVGSGPFLDIGTPESYASAGAFMDAYPHP